MPVCILEICAHFKQRERCSFLFQMNDFKFGSIAVNWVYWARVWVVWRFAKFCSNWNQDAETSWGFFLSSPHKAFIQSSWLFLALHWHCVYSTKYIINTPIMLWLLALRVPLLVSWVMCSEVCLSLISFSLNFCSLYQDS